MRRLKGRSIEDVGLEAARLSGGQGVFVLIAKDEKKLKVFTRRQFEHRFSEERREAIVKAFQAGFKTGDFDEGLKKGVDAIVAIVMRHALAEPSLLAADRPRPGPADACGGQEARWRLRRRRRPR